MYSAKKIQGRKLYDLARRGVEVEREAVRVRISKLETIDRDGALLGRSEDGTCDLSIRVVCSAGTYVRVLAESIGESLGVGAHLSELRRTRAGAFSIEQSVSVDRLNELVEGGALNDVLIDMNAALSELPATHLTADEARRVGHGAAIVAPRDASSQWSDKAHVRMCDGSGQLLAVGVYEQERGAVQPRVTLVEG
jgi:tRNA pseudouridine55 synthase